MMSPWVLLLDELFPRGRRRRWGAAQEAAEDALDAAASDDGEDAQDERGEPGRGGGGGGGGGGAWREGGVVEKAACNTGVQSKRCNQGVQ